MIQPYVGDIIGRIESDDTRSERPGTKVSALEGRYEMLLASINLLGTREGDIIL